MPSLKTKCSTCLRKFATRLSLQKHTDKIGHVLQEAQIQFYKPSETEPVVLPVPKLVSSCQEPGYKEFLNGVAEMTNSYLNPDVKSKWVKIDLITVPIEYFTQLLSDLGLNKPHSAREARHPAPLKKDSSLALYYNVYKISFLEDLFASAVPLKTKAYFRLNEEVRGPCSAGSG